MSLELKSGRAPQPGAAKGTQAVRRAIRILKAFDADRPTWEIGDLAEELALARPTVARIIGALEDEGMLVRSEGNRFTLGPELIVLGTLALRRTSLGATARPFLVELSEQIGEAVTLEVPFIPMSHGVPNMLVIEELGGRHLLGVRPFVGRRLPIHATSTGHAFLACIEDEKLEAILPPLLERFTERTLVERQELFERLGRVRKQGFAFVDQELETGLVAIAAPIVDGSGNGKAAISLHWPVVRFDRQKLAEFGSIVRSAAMAISKQFGFDSVQP